MRGGGMNQANAVFGNSNVAGSAAMETQAGVASPLTGQDYTDNTSHTNTSLTAFVIGLLILYFGWGYLQHGSMKEEIKPGNVAANLHNFFVIAIAAAIGGTLIKVATTKLASMQIPFLSWFAGKLSPFFR